LQQQQDVFTVADKTSEAEVHTSFVLLQIIAKRSKPLTYGEFEKECILDSIEILCSEKQQVLKLSFSLQTQKMIVSMTLGGGAYTVPA
jgi:hypothetical protein